MFSKIWKLILSGAVFASLLLISQIFISQKNFLSFQAFSFIKPPFALVRNMFAGGDSVSEKKALILENENLKAQLLALSKNPYLVKGEQREYLVAKIYSTYPFNNKGFVAINAGLTSGISKGDPVMALGGFLLGQVAEAFSDYSLVRTIFDSGWELPAKIGEDNVDALLVGGRSPRLTLIVNGKDLEAGEAVYSASKDFPFGMKFGEVSDFQDNVGGAFQEAGLVLPYEPKDLTEVFILR